MAVFTIIYITCAVICYQKSSVPDKVASLLWPLVLGLWIAASIAVYLDERRN